MNDKLDGLIALALNRNAAAGGAAAQRTPALTLADMPEAGLSKLHEAARSRMSGCSAEEAQVGVQVAV